MCYERETQTTFHWTVTSSSSLITTLKGQGRTATAPREMLLSYRTYGPFRFAKFAPAPLTAAAPRSDRPRDHQSGEPDTLKDPPEAAARRAG